MAKRGVSPEVARLRAEAVRLHKASTRKISRNKVARGANISGTDFDPRRDLSKVRNYNSKQLATYIQTQKEFVSRKTQFVPDAKYRPMPIADWKRVEKARDNLNQINMRAYNKIKNVRLANGRTVAEQLSMTDAIHPQMHNPASNSGHRAIELRSKSVKSFQALEKLEMDMYNRATPKYRAKMDKANHISVDKMLAVINDDELTQKINALSENKFRFMWKYSGTFAMDLSMTYEAIKKMLEADPGEGESLGKAYRQYGKRRDIPQLSDQGLDSAKKFVSWLEKEPEGKFVIE